MKKVKKMAEIRLIDGNELRGIESLLNTDIIQASKEASWLMTQVLHDIDAMPAIDPETLPIVRELREKLMLTEANQNHFKEERDLFLFKMKETAEAATSEIDRRNKTICELRAELEQVTAERDEARRDCAVAEKNHAECLARLAEARVKLKSSVTDMETLMWPSVNCVEVHREPYVHLDCGLGSGCECKPKWRGSDGDHQ